MSNYSAVFFILQHDRFVHKNYFTSMQTNEISEYLYTKGYSIMAFTTINAIFVRNDYIEKG